METRQVRNDYTLRFQCKLYQIERSAIVTGLRGANVRVENRLDGTVAVRYGEKYLPVRTITPAEKQKAPPAKQTTSQHRQPRRASDWNKNFDLKKAPKLWQVAQLSGAKRSVAE